MWIGGINYGMQGVVGLSFLSVAIAFLLVDADVLYSHTTELEKF